MPQKKTDDWQFEVLVPGAVKSISDEELPAGPSSAPHARNLLTAWFGDEEKSVEFSDVKGQWTRTIEGIVSAVSEWSAASEGKWKIDEVSFGLTLSAEGKLLFIAKAGAQASVQVKVKRSS